MFKMKKFYATILCLLLSVVFCSAAFAAETAVPQFQMANGYSVNNDGDISPYTYYINVVRSTISASGTTLNYTLYAGCAFPVRHIQARAVVQRYTSRLRTTIPTMTSILTSPTAYTTFRRGSTALLSIIQQRIPIPIMYMMRASGMHMFFKELSEKKRAKLPAFSCIFLCNHI